MKHQPFLRAQALVSIAALTAQLLAPAVAMAGGDQCSADCDTYHKGIVNYSSDHSYGSYNTDATQYTINANSKGSDPGKDAARVGGDRQAPMNRAFVDGQCPNMPTTNSNPLAANGSTITGKSGTAGTNKGSGIDKSSQGVDPNMCAVATCDSDWDKCFQALQAQWGGFAQYCQAIDVNKDGEDAEKIALVAYGIAAFSCTMACFIGNTPWGAGFNIACSVTGAGAAILDIAETVKVTDKSNHEINGWEHGAGFTAVSASAAGVGAGLSVISTIASSAAKGGIGGGSNSVGSRLLTCGAMVLMLAAVAMKADGMVQSGNAADDNCTNLKTFLQQHPLPSQTVGSGTQAPTDPNANKDSGYAGPGAPTKGATSGSTQTSNTSKGLPPAVSNALNSFPDGVKIAGATAGDVFKPLYNSIGGKENIDKVLQEKAGMNLKDLGAKLASGQSISSIMGGFPGMEQASAEVGQFEKELKNKTFSLNGAAPVGVFSSGGGGGKAAAAAAAPNPFGMFGMKGPGGGGGAPTETTFDKVKRDLAAAEASGDIWHEGFGGTIFQIVSGKLDKSRERIDQLEWDTPLNRALVGLPAKKKP